jgi:drug/metabolite transporter (DMT)-like permease
MMEPDHELTVRRRALAALLLGAACIAFAPIFVRLSDLGPVATAFYRVLLALPVLWFWMRQEEKRDASTRHPSSLSDYARLSLAGVFFACDLTVWHFSITMTTVANSTLFANAAPIWVTLGGFFLFGERFSRVFLAGLVCAVAGILLLMGESLKISDQYLAGDAMGVAASVFYAAYIMSVGRLRHDFSTATVMAWSGVVSAALLAPMAMIAGDGFVAAGLSGWLILLGLALISHAGGQSLIAYSLAHLPAALGAVGLLLQPVLAAVIAWFLFAEALGPLQVAGAICVLIGIYLARRGSS